MKKITIILLFLNICLKCIYSDNLALERLSSFVTNINTFNKLNPQEKVYVHFDNNGYFIGDTIWFQSYVVTADNNKPTNLSKVLYVELLSEDGRKLSEKKLKIEDGKCHGEFILRENYFSGYYEVRAFTRYMLNFGEDVVFSRVLPVYMQPLYDGEYDDLVMHKDKRKGFKKIRKEADEVRNLKIDFYPEGGNIIEGIKSRVAFKITDKTGNGV